MTLLILGSRDLVLGYKSQRNYSRMILLGQLYKAASMGAPPK